MSNKKLFPLDIMLFSAEAYTYRLGKNSNKVYNTIIIAVVAVLVSLFFITVPVTVQSVGLIKSQTEKTPVYVPNNGKVIFIHIKENLSVQQGDTLLMIENDVLKKQKENNKIKQEEYERLIADAKFLCAFVSIKNVDKNKIQTAFYKQSLLSAQEQYFQMSQRLELLQKKFERLKKLKEEKLIPLQEYENTEQELKQIEKELPLSVEKAKNQWQQDILNYQVQLREAIGNQEQINQQMQQYILRAPISGTLYNYTGILTNTFVNAGQTIAEISPDSSKIVECFVTPNNIGLIKKDMPIIFQVESFNYNEWGFLNGTVLDINNDVTTQQSNGGGQSNGLFFKVRCSMDKDYLTLKNGYKGYLKKGMT